MSKIYASVSSFMISAMESRARFSPIAAASSASSMYRREKSGNLEKSTLEMGLRTVYARNSPQISFPICLPLPLGNSLTTMPQSMAAATTEITYCRSASIIPLLSENTPC